MQGAHRFVEVDIPRSRRVTPGTIKFYLARESQLTGGNKNVRSYFN